MRPLKIYLAGYIQGSKIDECVEWRRKIRQTYDTNPKWQGCITWLDPLNGKDLATITPDGLKSDIPSNAIVHRDYMSVMEADLIIVNMDTFGEDRPLTGTICELAWAWEHHKPIIMITTENKYIEHPFLKYFASMVIPSVDELIEKKWVNYYYKGLNSAEY